MHKVILQLQLDPDDRSIKAIRRKLRLAASQIDRKFGIQPVRPEERLYAVRVDADVAERVHGENRSHDTTTPDSDDVPVALVH
ncbi:MAG TPA: hypothetical protein VF533_00735 [Solirubrobacteraceae bacterium]|jgi:hypothetical protein